MTQDIKQDAAGKRLFVLGANGRVGQKVVAQALERGADVTAFVRSAGSLPDHPRLSTVIGSVTEDRSILESALPGHDAVISALGNPLWLKGLKGPAIVEDAFANVIAAMQKTGIQRFVAPIAWGTGESIGPAGFLVWLVTKTLIKRDYRDFNAAERRLASSGLDWTLAYFGSLTDAPLSHGWEASPLIKTPRQMAIARADVADFLIGAAIGNRYAKQRVVLSGAKP